MEKASKKNAIPFPLKPDVPNRAIAEAIEEGRRIARDDAVSGCASMEELRAALEK